MAVGQTHIALICSCKATLYVVSSINAILKIPCRYHDTLLTAYGRYCMVSTLH